MSYKFQHGCIPCSFVCSCCDIHYYRCMSGVGMYYRGSSYRPDRIICEYCYQQCLFSSSCKIILEQQDAEQQMKIQEAIDQDYQKIRKLKREINSLYRQIRQKKKECKNLNFGPTVAPTPKDPVGQ